MELLGFKLFEKKPPPAQVVTPEVNPITVIDQQLAGHHQEIEKNAALATNQEVVPGSSIPTANTIPGNPLMVIQGPTQENKLIARQLEIDATLPKDYETVKTGFGNTWDRNLLGKDGMTTPDEFLAKQAEREDAKKAVQQQVAQENQLDKAA
jgi:hypothetical protein